MDCKYFYVKYEYLRSLQLCEDQGIRAKLKSLKTCLQTSLRFLQLIALIERPGF